MKALRTVGGYLGLVFVIGLVPTKAAELHVTTCTLDGVGTALSTVGLVSLGERIAGVQFDLEYDPAQVRLDGSWDPAQREAAKDLSQMVAVSPGIQRVLIVGYNENALFDGGLLDLRIELSPAGSECTGVVRLTKVVAVSPEGTAVPLSITIEPGSPVATSMGHPQRIGLPRPPVRVR